MQRYLYAALLCGNLLGLGSVESKTIRVPGDSPSINGGLTSADYGDTVLVSPGRYKENVTLVQGVILKGVNQLTTIIDGMRKGPTIYAVTGSEISHFTITNGIDGILCENSSPYIHHNWILDNQGAGIGAFISLPQIYNNVIYGNRWSGILAWGAKSLDTRIENNVVIRNGYSGFTLKGPCRIVVRNNIVQENREYGIYSDPASGQSQIVYNNIFKNVIPFNRYTKINKTNISHDPLFLSPSLGEPNYFVAAKSPMIRRGYGQVDIGLLAKDQVVSVDGDRDNDGIVDSRDVCPDLAEDQDSFQDDDGCPDFDNDNDGIQDQKDKCPSEPEDKDGFEDSDGCPETDNDKDGVPDASDNCPDVAGDPNKNGCPFKAPVKLEDNFILEGVNFRTGSAELTEDSYTKLDDVYEQLAKYSDRKYEIAGHTDNTASDKINIKLSLDRANAVREYLINRGVEGGRLVGKGYGSSRPKADNKTAAGRSINRRIEFYRIKK
ncbi:MAG: OmpA family protein [Fibrobacterota bacterium]|nr:OmpA family protein [Fibrobacterota bacterium]